ncbi:MAG: GNAT family N-acyltransferase [Hyphomicrobiaceae bacterium]
MRMKAGGPRGLARRMTVSRPYAGLPVRLLIRHTPRALTASFLARRKPIKTYGTMGDLEVRLARSARDIRKSQRLRYKVFYEEMAAVPNPVAAFKRRDEDAYDPICDHLLVLERPKPQSKRRRWRRRPRVVGTYRVLRQEIAEAHDGFYTQGEYDIAPLIAAKSPDYSFMELGRSCVLKPYRNKRTIELLWHGLWTYVREHGIDVMIGCASFEGTDPKAHANALSFLYHHALAPPEWRVKAHAGLYTKMDLIAKEKLDAKAALKALPPLIKGYLRLGAFVGDGAVVDRQFGTVDVCIILPVERIDPRYFAHFGAPDELTSRIAPEAKGVM